MAEPEVFFPRIPQPIEPVKSVNLPFGTGAPSVGKTEHVETLFSWMIESCKLGVRAVPKLAKRLAIHLGIVLAVNLLLWPLKTWQLPAPIDSAVKVMIFLTATYNNVIPKTVFWVIIFTFGRRLFIKIKNEGLAKAVAPIRLIAPEFKQAYLAMREKAWPLLLMGGGIGLALANNFASYSRFPEARNKFDKYFVALVISFAVSYILGESKKNWMFKFARLASSDFSRLMKRQYTYSDNHTFLLLTGFVAGLLLDAPLIALKAMYGGYILGTVLVAGALVLLFVLKPGDRT